ncbi:MAG: transglutaminase family protein [Amaricoccus sp.]|uniref:transglutaminase family protein n=1 Tax=Amaricoccus sp. TaxID=1872485 RepID=UPI0039E32BB0
MRLSVRHSTLYQFEAPMRFVTQSHRLTPAPNASQKVLDWTVSAEGATFGASFTDGAGDRITTMTLQGPVERITVVVEGTVETGRGDGILRGHREIVSPLVYLEGTQATQPTRAILGLRDLALRGAGGPLDRAHRLAAAVGDAIAYTPGATSAQTTAAEALDLGKGVCQDHAHALIAVAIAADLPARYVTGYLFTDDGAEASHAWAELHVADLGWIGFDPANRCCPDERYIRLGSGRDAREAAPIRGISRGGGAEALDVTVVVAQQ